MKESTKKAQTDWDAMCAASEVGASKGELVEKHVMAGLDLLWAEMEGDETIALLLKGHLVVERKLEQMLGVLSSDSKYLKKARLSFHQKMVIACAVSTLGNAPGWELVHCLNQYRNQIAHSLDAVERDTARQKLYRSFSIAADMSLEDREEDVALAMIFLFLNSFLSSIHSILEESSAR